ncbi:putative chaperone protein [Sphingomonas sp. SORGH_AS802]|uniref:Hsp70 family protein n=1 Tax=unclassified Sphingomonas TaxID=196159 RepID=UPI00285D476F|nr:MULTISPECIES: Hsp70 family protein [unclassified Sphingomonas]MDR6128436.1 putative chaperone protein [Sphingomonas sp. SORGH_AS_0438]MDR6135362.1 putative chaperone protein [Sphingomonas sp. SORGH_AS_0802]
MTDPAPPAVLGFDFGTTNSVAAIARGGESALVPIAGPDGASPVFRSALCFWQEESARGGLESAAGPWAIAEYLDFPEGSRFLQSFKSVAAAPSFEHATVFERRFRFEGLGARFLDHMIARANGAFDQPLARIVVGRPVEWVGHRPDEALARSRYDAMFAKLTAAGAGVDLHYVYEPLGAAFSYASTIDRPATVLVADFGGGTSDFSVVRIEAPGAARRCVPLGHAGVGIAGDRFDYRLVDHLVMPLLGKGGRYRSFDKVLEIPAGYFRDFGDWSRLALMRNRRTLADLEKLRRAALDPEAIARMIAVIEQEQGYRLYDAVGQVKRDLSASEQARFVFDGGGLRIEAEVHRRDFENWIAPDIARIEQAVDRALAAAGTDPAAIDRVFLTGGTSLTPRIHRLFVERFGEERLATGDALTSIAHGLALIGESPDIATWATTPG